MPNWNLLGTTSIIGKYRLRVWELILKTCKVMEMPTLLSTESCLWLAQQLLPEDMTMLLSQRGALDSTILYGHSAGSSVVWDFTMDSSKEWETSTVLVMPQLKLKNSPCCWNLGLVLLMHLWATVCLSPSWISAPKVP